MPLVRIAVPKGKSPQYRRALSAAIHAALVETFGVPEQDLFQIISEHAPDELVHTPSYLGNAYSDDLTIIQLTVSEGRSLEQKRRLFRAIAERLTRDPGVRPDDVFINLIEVRKENWSFGNGLAQYAAS